MFCSLFLHLHLICSAASQRVYPYLPSPSTHYLYAIHTVKAPELSFFSPTSPRVTPGFAALRGIGMSDPSAWPALVDKYVNSTASGGFDLANILWPDYRIVFSASWPVLGAYLSSRGLLLTDLGGFVPGGASDFDVAAAPSFAAGVSALGGAFLGMDMGEQDVRWLWGYAAHTTPLGPRQRFDAAMGFFDFSDEIVRKSGGRMVALSSSVYAVHHWLKSGLFTLAGSETSQSNGNAQVLYAFVRGAAKSYGSLWYGQVSIFTCFGYKIPGDPSPSPGCATQSDHSPTCGTSLNLMKRLMYAQLAYNPAYFAFEGQWFYENNASVLTPIGALQQHAKAFFDARAAPPPLPPLGVHVPTIALLLDFFGGWARPCDAAYFQYRAATWGALPFDASDFFADAVLDTAFPGYRAGARLRNESGYQTPTPYGDAVDVLLSDALPTVLALYDTVVLAHRAATDAADLAARLAAFVSAGGQLFLTAASLADFAAAGVASFAGVALGACAPAPAGAVISLVGGPNVTEPRPLVLCALALPGAGVEVLATAGDGAPAAARVAFGAGTATVLAAGNYGMATAPNPGPLYGCGVDEADARDAQPLSMAAHVRALLERALARASLFDLGPALAWVPQRESATRYVLTVSNPFLTEAPLNVMSRLGPVAWVERLTLDESEKGAVGYLPHGFEGAPIGNTTNGTLAGGDTILLRVVLASDASRELPRAGAPPAAAWAARRLLRLPRATGDLRRAVLQRPFFDSSFAGVLIDSSYVAVREAGALGAEAAWLRPRGVRVAVDFSASTTLFPGLRLVDDMGLYYEESVAALAATLRKLPALGARHALIALHGVSEAPPANFSTGTQRLTRASVAATLANLSALAASLNVTLHLRRSTRNDELAGASFAEQLAFAGASGLRLAPSLAFCDPRVAGDDVAAVTGAFAGGGAKLLLVSSAWESIGGDWAEGAPLAAGDGALLPALRAAHAAALAADDAWVVLDAGFGDGDGVGRAAEVADVRALEAALAQR